MKLKSQYAHNLIEQFVEWNRRHRGGPKGYRSTAPFVKLIPARPKPRAKFEEDLGEAMATWWWAREFNDTHANLADELLQTLEKNRPEEFKVLMDFYFSGQNLTKTAQRFNKRPEVIDTMVNTAIGYLDGQLSMLVA